MPSPAAPTLAALANARHEAAVDAPMDITVAVEAPEQIRFRFRLAGPAQRAMAFVIDVLLLAVAAFVLVVLAALLIEPFASAITSEEGARKFAGGLALIAWFVGQWGYFALWEGLWQGQTPGKRILHLRVVKSGGEPVGFMDAVLRNLLRAADWMPMFYAVGLASMMIDGQFRRLGDLVAGTMVVAEDPLRVSVPLYIQPPTLEEATHLPMRVMLDGEELRAIEMFLRRAPQLGGALATELASGVAGALGRKHAASHPDPVRLLALLYLRATVPAGSHNGPVATAVTPPSPPLSANGYEVRA